VVQLPEESNYFRLNWFSRRFPASKSHTIQRISGCVDDLVMKMQGQRPGFVDGLYAKFYSLPNELLRVGSKCNGSSARPDSFHPAEAVAGKERAASILFGSLIVPAPSPPERE
jgi:hypothetical protein